MRYVQNNMRIRESSTESEEVTEGPTKEVKRNEHSK